MIFNIVISLIILITFWKIWGEFRKDKSFIKTIYLKRINHYFIAILLAFGAMLTIIGLWQFMPKFMTWSWISSLTSGEVNGNFMMAPLQFKSTLFTILFWACLVLSMPYLVRKEEFLFRSLVFNNKKRLISSLKFGLAHMIVGVPLFIALIIAVIGFIFSIIYIKEFRKIAKIDPINADKIAVESSTSIHTKYNLVVITIAVIIFNIL